MRKKRTGKIITCRVCGEQLCSLKFYGHLSQKHPDISNSKHYYDLFLKKDKDGVCLACGKPTMFFSAFRGYGRFCSNKCAQRSELIKDVVKKSFFNKHGGFFNNRDKAKKTCLEKYGKSNVSQSDEVKEKKKKSFIERYGVSCWTKTQDHREFMEENHGWRNQSQISAYRLYSLMVDRETSKHKEELLEKWDGKDYYDNKRLLKDKRFSNCPRYRTIDHKISIQYGFSMGISPEIIGGRNNLCITSRRNNSIKKRQSDKEFMECLLI